MHTPVLKKEVLDFLRPEPDENFIDVTIGYGGHALAILEKTQPKGKLLGIDLDQRTISDLAKRLENTETKDRLVLVADNFVNLAEIVRKNNFTKIKGIIADLGMSSMTLAERGRGFSFLKDEPLDMRFGDGDLTAEKIINNFEKAELERILNEYGEEKFAEKIAGEIAGERRVKLIKTTFDLVGIIKRATPIWYQQQRLHFATKVFQALRIAVNDELENLINFLPFALALLERGGRLAIISFHSLEDRIIKNFFKASKQQKIIQILTKKPIQPGFEEIGDNPRSRSAKLRAALKI